MSNFYKPPILILFMGAIRGVLLVFVAVLLFLSFFSLNLLWTVSSSLEYENVQKQSTLLANDLLNEVNITEIVVQNYPMIQLYCMNHTNYVFSYQGFTFDIPCSVALQGADAIVEEMIGGAIHGIYYAEYDCGFIDCFEKYSPVFLLSEKFHNFVADKVYFPLILALVLFALVFLLVQKKTNAFIVSGILLIVSSLPFVKLDYLLSLFPDKMIFRLLWVFLSRSFYVSIRLLIIGAALLVFGILLDIFKVGLFISNLFSRFRKEKKEKVDKKKEAGKKVKKPNKKSK